MRIAAGTNVLVWLLTWDDAGQAAEAARVIRSKPGRQKPVVWSRLTGFPQTGLDLLP